jgi:hypothetical protein
LINFPEAVGRLDTTQTTFPVSGILSHLVPEARIIVRPIFGGNTAASTVFANTVEVVNAGEENQSQAQPDQTVGDETSRSFSGDEARANIEANAAERFFPVAQTDWDAASNASTASEFFPEISIEKEALDLLDTIQRDSSKNADRGRIILAGYGFGGIVLKQVRPGAWQLFSF